MARGGITVKLLNGGLGRRQPTDDSVFGFVTNGIAVAGKLVLGTTYQLKGTRDANLLGLDNAYDSTNKILVYHHIERYFLRNPNGEINLLLAPQTASMTDMVDKTKAYAQKLLKDAAGRIKVLFVALNPIPTYVGTMLNGLDADVLTAVPKAQDLHTSEFAKFRYVDIILEGRSFNGTATAAKDLRTLQSPNVSVVIAQDPAVAALQTIYSGYAAVGDFCGHLSAIAVSQNVGEQIPEFDMTSPGDNVFLTANLSSALPVNSYVDEDLDTLHDKGFIFLAPVPGIPGLYWNDSHTCTVISDDYAYIERNRTINKAIRLVRAALLPKVKARVKVDPGTGKLLPEERKALENTASSALDTMGNDGDISGGVDAYIDPAQNVLSTDEIITEITFVPVAIGRKITLSIGFKNPLKSN